MYVLGSQPKSTPISVLTKSWLVYDVVRVLNYEINEDAHEIAQSTFTLERTSDHMVEGNPIIARERTTKREIYVGIITEIEGDTITVSSHQELFNTTIAFLKTTGDNFEQYFTNIYTGYVERLRNLDITYNSFIPIKPKRGVEPTKHMYQPQDDRNTNNLFKYWRNAFRKYGVTTELKATPIQNFIIGSGAYVLEIEIGRNPQNVVLHDNIKHTKPWVVIEGSREPVNKYYLWDSERTDPITHTAVVRRGYSLGLDGEVYNLPPHHIPAKDNLYETPHSDSYPIEPADQVYYPRVADGEIVSDEDAIKSDKELSDWVNEVERGQEKLTDKKADLGSKDLTDKQKEKLRADIKELETMIAETQPKIDQKTPIVIREYEDALAFEALGGNKYSHQIEIEIKKDSRIISVESLKIGDLFTLVAKEKTYDSILTGMRFSSDDDYVYLRFGNLRYTLDDALD